VTFQAFIGSRDRIVARLRGPEGGGFNRFPFAAR
jgi:hypothetical protein